MAIFTRHIRQLGLYSILITIICILSGCAKDFHNITEKYVDDKRLKVETNTYYIVAYHAQTGEIYPQIVLKGNKDVVCGTDFLNNLLQNTYYSEYQIVYADDSILSVCFWQDTENGKIPKILTLNLQCINYRAFSNGSSVLLPVQDDNDFCGAPWPGNGITISFDKLLQEFEQGNYYLDEEAYDFQQSQPQLFTESVQRQFQEIEERGFLEAYYARFFEEDSIGAYKIYLKEGRVGFFISSAERWDALEAGIISYETMPYDFSIEIAYDWKADMPMYQVPYEVYRKEWGNGEFSYLQVNGIGESEEDLNAAILEDLLENLQHLDVEKTNSIMREYRDTEYWHELPQVGPPRVTWQSERYLCIRQEPLLNEAEVLRFAEEWKRYHVYDLETGESLKLGDIIKLDQNFVKWLREEKKVEAWTEYHEGGTHGELGEILDELLEAYSEEQLFSVLEDTEFWLKEETIYFRLPFLDEYGKPLYSYGGTGWPNYLVYAECRISKDDLEDFLLSEVLDKVLNKSDVANKINMEKNKNTQLKRKKQKFDRQGLFLFDVNPNLSPKESAMEEQKHQEDLLELMAMYQAYHDFVQEKLYAIRGSKLMCLYGTKPALLDTLEDHGVYVGNMPVMTCNDCRQANIHNFGSCMCPESVYEERGLPMTVEVHPNGELAHKAPWNKRPHICVPLLGEHSRWIQKENELVIANTDNEEMETVLTDEATLTCMYGGIIMIGEVPEKKNNENIPIILDGWLTEPTVSADGREVLKHPEAANRDWAMPEDLKNHSEDWFETKSPVKEEISAHGNFEVKMISNNLYTDYEGRYWVAVGPNVMNPEHPKEQVNHSIPVKDMCYGTKIDIVVLNKEENIYYYIPAVVGDAKEHSYPDGLYQTGIPFNYNRPEDTSNNRNTVEFIGYQITRKIYEDGKEKSTINITNNYILVKIIVYDGVFNYK